MISTELQYMRAAGQATAAALDFISPFVVEGATTESIDDLCRTFIVEQLHGEPASLGYLGFPKSICTSVNHVIAHGIPGKYKLQDGDIVNVDIAVKLNGYFGDSSRMFCIGNVSKEAKHLVDQTQLAMWKGIFEVAPGKTVGDIGAAIMHHANVQNLGVVWNYGGHGIGTKYHTTPQIANVGMPGTGVKLTSGMIFTVEPMLTLGTNDNHVENDNWTVVTNDGKWSAQWEHTVLVTDSGFEILTLGQGEVIPVFDK